MHYKKLILNAITPITRTLGFDLIPYKASGHPSLRRQAIIRGVKPDVILDIGANTGQYGRWLRKGGYPGRIVSFEPMTRAFERLAAASARDPLWEVHNYGLGREATVANIHVSANSASSSFLEMTPRHSEVCPSSRTVGAEEVEIRTIDSLITDLSLKGKRLYVKIDTQGFELEVLSGATQLLDQIVGLEVEASLTELYKGQPQFADVCGFLHNRRFIPVAFQPAFSDPKSGYMLQVDAFFVPSDH